MLKTTKKINVITAPTAPAKSEGGSTRKVNANRTISVRLKRAKSIG